MQKTIFDSDLHAIGSKPLYLRNSKPMRLFFRHMTTYSGRGELPAQNMLWMSKIDEELPTQ